MRLGNNIADVYAPGSSNVERVRKSIRDKVSDQQASHLVVNLGRTDVTRKQVEDILQRKPVAGLRELLIIEKNGAISRTLPDPAEISPPLPSNTPSSR